MCKVWLRKFDELSKFPRQSVPIFDCFPMNFKPICIPLDVDHLFRQKVGRKYNPK